MMQRRIMVKVLVVTLVLGGSLLLGMGTLFVADKSPAGKAGEAKDPKAQPSSQLLNPILEE